MGLKRQIEKLRDWACDKVNDCHSCEYCIETDHWDDYADDWESYCPFDFVFNAAVDRAKEELEPLTTDVKVDESEG